jgi:hypothetical protein
VNDLQNNTVRRKTLCREFSARKNGFVYFVAGIDVLDTPYSNGLVKIGFTQHLPHKRLRALQCGSPVMLNIFAYTMADRFVEKAFHEAFAPLRSHGEWFFANGKLFDFLCYLDASNVDGLVSPNDIADSIHDNLAPTTANHPFCNERDWVASATAEPLLHFYQI